MYSNLASLTLSALSTQDKLGWGFKGLVIGLGSVFLILVILIGVIMIMKVTSTSKKQEKAPVAKTPAEVKPVAVKVDTDDESQIIAVIMAAVNCMAQREGKKFAIKSYKRVGSRTKRSY